MVCITPQMTTRVLLTEWQDIPYLPLGLERGRVSGFRKVVSAAVY